MAEGTEVRANIVATDSTAPGIDSAKAGFDDLEEHVESGMERVAERLMEYFAIEKIVEFTKDAVEEFAKVGRQMDILGAQVTNAGENWGAAKENIDAFIKSQEILSGQSKEDVLQTLIAVETKTQDLAAAMKITDIATKLQMAGVGQLTRNVKILTKAYEGSAGGVQALGGLLALNDTKSKNSALVFADLEKKIAGVGTVAGDTQGKLNTMGVVWEETTENVGGELATLIPLFGVLEKSVSTLLAGIFGFGNLIEDAIVIPFTEVISIVGRTGQAFDGLLDIISLKDVRGGFQEIGRAVKGAAMDLKESGSLITDDLKKTGGEITGIWSDTGKQVSLITDKQFQNQADKNAQEEAKELAATKKHREKKVKDYSDMVIDAKEAVLQINDAFSQLSTNPASDQAKDMAAQDEATKHPVEAARKAANESEQAWKDAYAQATRYQGLAVHAWDKAMRKPGPETKKAAQRVEKEWKDALKEVQKADDDYAKHWQTLQDAKFNAEQKEADRKKQYAQMEVQTALQTADLLISLSGSTNKTLAGLAKDAAVAKATINAFLAASNALGEYPYPYSIVMAALAGASGALEVANIEGVALASGGILTGPQMFLGGEGGEPEAVVPLSKSAEFGFGGGGNTTHNWAGAFPGVTNKQDARGVMSTALSFLKTQSASNVRAGKRNA